MPTVTFNAISAIPRRLFSRQWGLRLKILAWSFIPTFVILLAVATVNFVAYQQVTEELVIGRDRELVRLAATQLANDLNAHVNLLTAVSRTIPDDLPGQRAALEAARNRLAVFDGGVLLINRFGRIVATEPAWPELVGRDRTYYDYFHEVMNTGQPVFSQVWDDGPGYQRVVAVAVPVADAAGETGGALVGFFRLGEGASNALYSSIVRLHSGEYGSTYLVDRMGMAIFHTSPHRIGQMLASRTAVRALLRGETGAARTYEFFDVELIAAYSPVPGTSWGLASEESWDLLFSSSQGYRRLLLSLLALGMVVPALVVVAGVRRITRPLTALTSGAQQVAAGHFDRIIDVHTGDELEELARQFNQMSARLQESYAHLEQRVADRTRELATLNSIAAVVSRSLDLEDILQAALAETAVAITIDTAEALYLDEEAASFLPVTGWGEAYFAADEIAQLPHNIIQPLLATAAPQAMPAAIFPDEGYRARWQAAGFQQIIQLPLVAKEQVRGLILLGRRTAQGLTPDDVTLLAAIGLQVGVAVENSLLYRQAERLAVLEERQRLSRDLHDSVTQALYSVTLFAGAATRTLAAGDAPTVATYVDQIQEMAQEALKEMRLLIFELRPPVLEQEGLAVALQARLESVEGRAGMQTALVVEGNGRLPAPIENALYRLAQESLNNILKHAQASKVAITLRWDAQHVFLQLTDNGVGFDLAQSGVGLGLPGMAERVAQVGGKLAIISQPGNGTTIQAEVPL